MGGALAAHLHPRSVSGSTLHVAADSPAWLENAGYYKKEIMARLAPLGIKDLKLKAGGVFPLPVPQAKPGVKAVRALGRKEREFIDGAIIALRDEELKEVSRRLLEKTLRREK